MNYDKFSEARKQRTQVSYFISIGRYERAKSIASEIIAKYPEYPYAYYDMAACEYFLGRTDNAIELCYKALDLGMSPLSINVILMLYYNKNNHFEKVDECFYEVNKIMPGDSDALAIYGYSMWKRGKKEEGSKLLEEAYSADCNNPVILEFLLRTSKRDKGQLKEIVNIYMNTGASEKRKLLFAGRSEMYMKNWREAKKNFAKVLNIDPKDEEAKDFLKLFDIEAKLLKYSLVFIIYSALVFILYFSNILRVIMYFSPVVLYLSILILFEYKKRNL